MPALTALNASPPTTAFGTELLTVSPSPSWPLKSSPQQYAAPAAVMPHAWVEPRLIVVNVSAPGTGAGAADRDVAASPAVSVAVGPRPPQQYPTPLVVTAQA